MKRYDYKGTTVSRPCRTKTQGAKVVRWLRARCILAAYSAEDREVWAPVSDKRGSEWTLSVLDRAMTEAGR